MAHSVTTAAQRNRRDPDPQEAAVLPTERLAMKPLPWWKRATDIVGAAVCLIVFSPLMFFISLAVKCSSGDSVIFKQHRAGLGGRPFTLYKFRSMHHQAEQEKSLFLEHNVQSGAAFKMARDPRCTPVGRLIRRWSVDELPQLLNVLRGDMSLVGPRPLPCEETAALLPWQRRRLEVTPGITGIWQVSGRSLVPFDEWMRMDIRYVGSRSFLLDVQLLLATLPAVFSRMGAY